MWTKCFHRYRSEAVRLFESWLKKVKGFREAVTAKQERREERREEMKAGQFAEAMRIVLENKERKVKSETTTQLVKPRFPPLQSGQKFNRLRVKVEKWFDNNKSSDEEKYIDLMESLKRNENIKEFVVKTLVEKVGETKTVKRVLDVVTEMF